MGSLVLSVVLAIFTSLEKDIDALSYWLPQANFTVNTTLERLWTLAKYDTATQVNTTRGEMGGQVKLHSKRV